MSAIKCFMKLVIMFICYLFIVNKVYATDLGVMGETYPILEMDFLDYIQSRAFQIQQNGAWQSLQRHATEKATSYRDRPTKVEGITRTVTMKSWEYDPSIVLDHDVFTPDGKLIAVAGTRINPLLYISLNKTLIFYNSDDQAQVKWAIEQDKKLHGKDKLILVNGAVLEQEKQFKKPVYFDQSGKLTSRFGITHVPATVSQKGSYLMISEVLI